MFLSRQEKERLVLRQKVREILEIDVSEVSIKRSQFFFLSNFAKLTYIPEQLNKLHLQL
jgi:hypothetical protein